MAESPSQGTVLVVAGALVQCFFYGLYTALFFFSATFTLISRCPRRWTLLPLNATIYLLSTATLYYDLVMACVSVETQNTVRLYRLAEGGDTTFLRTRISLFILISYVVDPNLILTPFLRTPWIFFLQYSSGISSTLTGFLVIWRLSRLWLSARYLAAVALCLNAIVAGSGLVLIHLRGGGPELSFRYDLYRRMAFSLFACLMMVILGRSYWMSRQLRKLYGSPIYAYTFTGACIDSGMVFILCHCINLGLTFSDILILRPVLPQFAGMAGALILFQESLGRGAQDLSITVRAIEEGRNGHSTPILDTLFSTPGASMQYTIGQGGGQTNGRRSRIDGSFMGSLSAFSIHSCSQPAAGDDGNGEAQKSKLTVDNISEDVRRLEKVHVGNLG